MTRLFGSALLGLAGLAIVATGAMAGVPDQSQSSIESVVIGSNSGLALGGVSRFGTSGVGGYQVTVRDAGGTPLAGVNVTLDFANTAGTNPAKPYDAQTDGSLVACPVLSQVTDGAGNVLFIPRLGGFDNAANVDVRANGVFLGAAPARSTDLSGDGNTDGADLAFFADKFLNDPLFPATDYNTDGTTDGADLAIFATDFLANVAQTVCP